MILHLLSLATAATACYLAYSWTARPRANRKHPTRTPHIRHRAWAEHRSVYFSYGLILSLAALNLGFEYEVLRVPYVAVPEYFGPEELINEVYLAPRPPRAELPPPPTLKPTRRLDLSAPIEFATEALPDVELLTEEPTPHAEALIVNAPPPPLAPAPPAPPAPEYEDIEIIAEQMPRFPGCEDVDLEEEAVDACATQKLFTYLKRHLDYPEIAAKNGVEGTAVVRFVVERDGSITDAEIVRDPGAGTGAEALRVVDGFPRWTPGRQRGRPVRVQYNLPVRFRLD